MKILITGSSGMLGTEFCGVFKGGHEVIGMDVREAGEGCPAPDVFRKVDITDPGQVRKVFDEERPELVIHAAAWTDVDGCEKDPERADLINVAGTRNIAVSARAAGNIPVVFISTDFVFDGEKSSPYTERDKGHPLSVYGKSKWDAEKALEETLEKYLIVRTSWLYGRNGKNFVDTVVAKGIAEGHLRVVSDQVGSPTYAKDLARAIRDLINIKKDPRRDIYHICNSGRCSWQEFAVRIMSLVKDCAHVTVEPVTSAELSRPAPRPKFSVLDNSRFSEITGSAMRPWDEALEEYLRERYGDGRRKKNR
ncbi:MAG: dTDP-4-dehydrorhamnose reductase [Candidatus Omnitrophota bacterium]